MLDDPREHVPILHRQCVFENTHRFSGRECNGPCPELPGLTPFGWFRSAGSVRLVYLYLLSGLRFTPDTDGLPRLSPTVGLAPRESN